MISEPPGQVALDGQLEHDVLVGSVENVPRVQVKHFLFCKTSPRKHSLKVIGISILERALASISATTPFACTLMLDLYLGYPIILMS